MVTIFSLLENDNPHGYLRSLSKSPAHSKNHSQAFCFLIETLQMTRQKIHKELAQHLLCTHIIQLTPVHNIRFQFPLFLSFKKLPAASLAVYSLFQRLNSVVCMLEHNLFIGGDKLPPSFTSLQTYQYYSFLEEKGG